MEAAGGNAPLTIERERVDGGERLARRAALRVGTARRERRDAIARRFLALGDVIAIGVGGVAAAFLSPVGDSRWELPLAILPTLPVWLVIIKVYGLYERDAKRISHSSLDDLPPLFHALLGGTLLLWGYTKVVPVHQLTFAEAASFGTVSLVTAVALRALVRKLIPRFLGPERVLLAGKDATVASLIRKIDHHAEYGLEITGLLAAPGSPPPSGPHPVVGDTDDLAGAVAATRAHRVVICRPAFDEAEVLEMIETCRRLSVKVSILPDAVDALGPSTEIDEVEGVTLLGVNAPVLGRTSRMLKRGFDCTVAGLLLVLLAPTYPFIALAIKLDSKGPVLFGQTRVGKAGRRFRLLKFRTMVADAEQKRLDLLSASRDPNWLLLDHDPRVTPVGRFLRRTSLDEIPQLWNVIKGEMSLVGPRPLPEDEDARIGGRGRRRLDLTPGITGLWQVLGRTRIPFAEMLKLDYVYVTNWSLWLDFKLLLQTLPVVLRRRGVN